MTKSEQYYYLEKRFYTDMYVSIHHTLIFELDSILNHNVSTLALEIVKSQFRPVYFKTYNEIGLPLKIQLGVIPEP